MSESAGAVALVVAEADRPLGDFLLLELNEAELHVVENPVDFSGSSAVVLISSASVGDTAWRRCVEAVATCRLIPVRIGEVDTDQLPQQLRDVQWEQFRVGFERELFGVLLTTLSISVDDRRRLRKLEVGATSWASAGRRASLLVDDADELADLHAVGARLSSTLQAETRPIVDEFLARSRQRVRTRRRSRLVRWSAGAVALIAAGVTAVAILPRLREIARTTTSNIVFVPEPSVERDLPQWSALLAASALLQGTEEQEQVARETLARDLTLAGPVGQVDTPARFAIEALTPMETRPSMVAVVRDDEAFSLLVQSSTDASVELLIPLPGEFWFIDLDDSEETAVVVGGGGVALVDLRTGSLTSLSPDRFDRVVVVDDAALVGSFAGRLARIDLDSRTFVDIGQVDALLSFGAVTSQGRTVGAAAVARIEDEYALVDARTGDVQTTASVPTRVAPLATVTETADTMIVLDDDRSLWKIASDGTREPVGVSVPYGTFDLLALPDDRLAIVANEHAVRVVDLRTGATLGTTCRPGAQVQVLSGSATGDHLGCLAGRSAEVWPTPRGAVPTSSLELRSNWSTVDTVASGQATLERRSGEVRFSVEGLVSEVVDVGTADFVAAISDDERSAVIGMEDGDVLVLTAHDSGQVLRTFWSVPDGAAIDAAGWTADGPAVRVVDSRAWRVPWCGECTSDSDMLDELAVRLVPCWGQRQLEPVSSSTRKRLGVSVCDYESMIPAT